MSFWNQGSTACPQYIENLLNKEDVSLSEVLDQSEVLQECKSQNKTLIEYLARIDVLRELIEKATKEPEGENGDPLKYKYANVACELLTCEVPLLTQTVANNPGLLSELYSFLDVDPPLNPLLASFFSRIMTVLVSKTSEQNWFSYQVTCLQVLEFIKSKGNGVALILRHMGTSAIMDMVHKLYIRIEGIEIKDNLLNWLDEGEFIERLIDMVHPDTPEDTRANACQLLCDLTVSGREICQESNDQPEPDVLVKKIESEEMVQKLISVMLSEPRCDGSIVGGISILLTLLRSSRRDNNNDQSYAILPSTATVNTISEAIIPQLPQIVQILHKPPFKAPVRTTVGTLEVPVGATRVELTRFMAVLTNTGHENLLAEIKRHDLLNVLLDLFFQYPWNSFLHTQVEAMVEAAYATVTFAVHTLSHCRLMQRIMNAWKDNDAQQKDLKPRRGYMGHLIRISNRVVEAVGKPPLESFLPDAVDADTRFQWQIFVTNDLAKVNGDQTCRIVEIKQEENDDEIIVHELYRRYYELQTVAAPFPENFHDGQLENNDSNLGLGSLTKPDFPDDDSDEEMQQQTSLFEQVCGQKLQTLDDDEELWSGITHRQSSSDKRDTRAWNDEGSSDEEQSNPGDYDDFDDWTDTQMEVPPIEQNNPWSSDVLSTTSPDQGWANFEASPFLANFGFDLSSTIATSNPGDDVERVPFDLTPTESQLFPVPAETPPSDIDSSPTFPGKADPPTEILLSGDMEKAEILESTSSAEFMAFSDLVEQVRSIEMGEAVSPIPNPSSEIAAVPTETVIAQTEAALPSNIPSEVATELAQLLAEVSEASITESVPADVSSEAPPAPVAIIEPTAVKDIEQSPLVSGSTSSINLASQVPCEITNSTLTPVLQSTDTKMETDDINQVPDLKASVDTELRTDSEPQITNGPVSIVDTTVTVQEGLETVNTWVSPVEDLTHPSRDLSRKDNNELCAPMDGSESLPNLSKSKITATNEEVPSPNGPVTI